MPAGSVGVETTLLVLKIAFLVLLYQLAYLTLARFLAGPSGPAFALAAFVGGLWITTMMNAQAHAAVETYTDCQLCNTRTILTVSAAMASCACSVEAPI